ncbi:DUF3795 domain-containing protein [Acetobacterium bakii]|uniref:DUF3795 domain-containing protein n=1 Tax=Acetobacterium bakii TaxID=52689 RepID=A0A0L6TWG3_9FIRM|nr:DUF3795 domain-containing protein [Acetobacterium bakii]KNZ40616.1 hypothetical protein AKG39_16670 [Acetobacterium bakii]
MEEKLIAPCGMNCGVCVSYLAMKNDLKKQGFNRKYCAGCLPRGKNCTFMKDHCDLLGKGLVRFCYECGEAISCHNGLCLNCDLEKLRQNKKYRWDEE